MSAPLRLMTIGHTLHHPHFTTTLSDHTHDPRMGDGILDFHRGTVDFLRCQLGGKHVNQLTFNFLVSFRSLYIWISIA